MRRCHTARTLARAWAPLAFALTIAGAGTASAQTRRPPLRPAQPPPTQANPTFKPSTLRNRRFIRVGGAFRLPTSFSNALAPTDFAERGTLDTRYSTKVLPGFEVGGGLQLWPNLSLGAEFERLSKGGSGTVTAQVPHPFFFNRLRSVSGDTSDVQRTETDLHIQALWTRPLSDRIDVVVAGGPSLMWLRQDIVRGVTVAQTYPYDTATFSGIVAQKDTKGRLGFNGGLTLDYRLAPRMALGITARYSRARVNFDSADSGRVSVTAGGARIGAGLRFRF